MSPFFILSSLLPFLWPSVSCPSPFIPHTHRTDLHAPSSSPTSLSIGQNRMAADSECEVFDPRPHSAQSLLSQTACRTVPRIVIAVRSAHLACHPPPDCFVPPTISFRPSQLPMNCCPDQSETSPPNQHLTTQHHLQNRFAFVSMFHI